MFCFVSFVGNFVRLIDRTLRSSWKCFDFTLSFGSPANTEAPTVRSLPHVAREKTTPVMQASSVTSSMFMIFSDDGAFTLIFIM